LCHGVTVGPKFHSISQAFLVMMRTALRHPRRLVSEEPLHLVEVHSRLDQPRHKSVAEIREWSAGTTSSRNHDGQASSNLTSSPSISHRGP